MGSFQLDRRVRPTSVRRFRVIAAVLAIGLGLSGCEAPAPSRPSVLLVTLDTTRVDHLSVYGYERPTSPTLESLARSGVRHTRVWSTSSWTLPAHASLFTGLFPAEHGARHDDRGSEALGNYRVGALRERFETLAERFSDRGYATAAFIGGPWLKQVYGLMQGFDHVDDEVRGLTGPRARDLSDRAITWLEQTSSERPFFLFVNYFDAHWPYAPPDDVDGFGRFRESVDSEWWDSAIRGSREVSADERAVLVDRYDSEIRYMDAELSRLIAAADGRAHGAGLLIVVTADHGEAFGEGGRFLHNYWLSEELTRVPLIVRYPDGRRAGESDDAPMQLTDVHDLIVAEAGVGDGARRRDDSHVFTELYRSAGATEHFGARFDRSLQTISDGVHKLEISTNGAPILYRLGDATRGAGESASADLRQRVIEQPAAADEAALERLRVALGRHLSDTDRISAEGPELDSETRKSLRALGYVE